MDYREQLLKQTAGVVASILKYARAMPEDKLRWRVNDVGRSALDMLQEIAQSPTYIVPILRNRSCPPFDPEMFGEMTAARQAWNSIDACEKVWNENFATLKDTVESFPEDEMTVEIDLPFVEGLRQSFADIMSYPYWNAAYHLGQICFIQTLYGDMEMR